MSNLAPDIYKFLTEYSEISALQMSKINNFESKRFYATGISQVAYEAAMHPDVNSLVKVLEKMALSTKVPKTRWLILANPEWYTSKSIQDAVDLCMKHLNKLPQQGNVVQLNPKL